MSAEGIFVVGASGHAKVVIDILERQLLWRVAGLIDTFQAAGNRVMGYEVLGTEDRLPELMIEHRVTRAIIAIGDNRVRRKMTERIAEIAPKLAFATAIHPSSRIAREVEIGQGVVIMAGATINSGTHLGDFCFVNTNASVDHDNVLEPFSCIQPNAATGGNVRLGAMSVLSMGAHVIQGIRIGADTLIGAGSTVLADIPGAVVAYGTPCRVVRTR